ncbi:MAG: hypothetical protein KAS67_00900 [Thermoplasmata archaeon]|nr:hypothetical protein [Thermoplasmata archaeon]
MDERLIRGHVINRYLSFIKNTWGKDGMEQAIEECGISEIKVDDSIFYSNEIMERILKWISTNHGMDRVKQAGKYTAKNLGLFAYMVRFMSMEAMLHKAEERYRELYKFGDIDIEIHDKKAIARMRDVSGIEENCQGWLGVLEAMLEMTKSKGTVAQIECQVNGDASCIYVVEWQ